VRRLPGGSSSLDSGGGQNNSNEQQASSGELPSSPELAEAEVTLYVRICGTHLELETQQTGGEQHASGGGGGEVSSCLELADPDVRRA